MFDYESLKLIWWVLVGVLLRFQCQAQALCHGAE